MRRFLYCLLLICSHVYGEGNMQLHGIITHPLSDSITITYETTTIIYQPFEQSVRLGSDGAFMFSVSLPEGYTKVKVMHGGQNTELFVQPGADLNLTVDAARFDSSLHYSGKGEGIANFMAKRVLQRNLLLSFNMQGMMLCRKEPADFMQAFDSLEHSEFYFIDVNGRDLSLSFSDYLKSYFRYMKYNIMEVYPHQHEMFKQGTNKVTVTHKEDYLVIDQIPEAFDDALIDNPGYQAYLTNYFSLKIIAANADHPEDKLLGPDTLLALAYTKMPPKTAEYYAGREIAIFVRNLPEDKLQKEYEEYKGPFPHSSNLTPLAHAIAIKKTIGVGKPAVDFDIKTPEGKTMKLSDLKGKIVYLDFWSSGCAPCIAEMPDAKKIHEYFKNKPVAFVNVSFDQKDETWKYAIKKFDVEGINTLEEKGFESDVARQYGIKSIPTYFLIDKDGKFAVIENLARPSDGEKLKAQIEKLAN